MKTKMILILLVLASMTVVGQGPNDADRPVPSTFSGFNNRVVVGSDSFDGTEALMSPRFFRAGVPADPCAEFSSGNFQYKTYPFMTDGSGLLTVSFDPAACGTGIFVTFHNTSFNPASICDNYVWSFGSSAAFTDSFAVTPNTEMVMVVSGVANAPGAVCGPYTWQIDGGNPINPIPTLSETAMFIMIGAFALIGLTVMVLRRKRMVNLAG